eukprot:CAMPEP_0114332086 /NCGR_PEP_ID=MMETSP0101-20121206/2841_1 /TAXON_ID=38822 ORGANISM="Pteridomonas danica, Strain PT" /NCGR_SAMPLE_ID=MMETSP0101 /ASSEMBLY_ACC=CAM_ASM_000211 /LENGTH=491 /DNA_ID=CAMNT_0001462629 /DNA_START=416 /DNA_END=1890 /DNA_ORIENTATION=+
MALSPNILCMILAELVLGVSQSLLQIGRQSYMKTAVSTEMSGRALSLLGGSARLAGILGPSLGGFLIVHWSVRIALASQAVTCLIAFVATVIFLKEIPTSKSNKTVFNKDKLKTNSEDGKNNDEWNAGNDEDGNERTPSLRGEQNISEHSIVDIENDSNDDNEDDDVDDDVVDDGEQKKIEEIGLISGNTMRKKEGNYQVDVSKDKAKNNIHNDDPSLLSVWLQYWQSLVVIALYACSLFVARTARDLILPLVSIYCGATPTQVGMISSASYLIDSSVFYIAGIIMDQAGRKVNAIASPLFYIAGYLQLAFTIVQQVSIPSSASSSIDNIVEKDEDKITEWNSTHVLNNMNSFENNNIIINDEEEDGDDKAISINQTVYYWLILAALILGFANGLGSGLAMTLSSDIAPKDSRSRGHFLGIYRMFCDSGALIGSLLVGIIAEEFSLFSSCMFCAAASLAATLQALFCIQETLPPNTPTAKFFRKLLKCQSD